MQSGTLKVPVKTRFGNIFIKYEKYIFFGFIFLSIFPVWANNYFLTLDGPCHLYNSKMLLDYVRGDNADFYKNFYSANFKLYPNWFSHAVLAFFMFFLPPVTSEKLFITIYILLFLGFSRMLVKKINPDNIFVSYLFFPLLFHYSFQMGFYNYSYSLVFCFAYIVFFIKYKQNINSGWFMLLSVIFLSIIFFSHPIGYLLTLFSICLYISFNKESKSIITKKQINSLLVFFVTAIPSVLLLLNFFSDRSGYPAQPGKTSAHDLMSMLLRFKAIATWQNSDSIFGKIFMYAIILLLIVCIFNRIKEKKIKQFDFFLIIALLMLVFYFKQPDSFAGAGLVNERIMILPVFFVILWIASAKYPDNIKYIFSVVLLAGSIFFQIRKYPHIREASNAVTEYMELAADIKPYSVVLPLDYSHNGIDNNGRQIAEAVWIFTHALDYLGAEKPLIMLDNYEANTGFFPFLWVWEKNPFKWLSKDAGIEGQPASIDMNNYFSKAGEQIDYIILFNYKIADAQNPVTQNTFYQINQKYTLLRKSSEGRALLYKLKGTENNLP